jgi:hypothetical protein
MENCKYCESKLVKVEIPPDSDWGVDFLMVCMNDDCGYYQRGWEWMWKNYEVKSSYRYHFNPSSGYEGPLHVTKPDDYKNFIISNGQTKVEAKQ